MSGPLWVLATAGVVLTAYLLAWRRLRSATREARFAERVRSFHVQRERLEAKFVQLAAAGGQPGALDWEDCDFDDDVAYVRNRSTGELSAFVGVTVASEGPVSGSVGGDDVTGTFRAGTAIFRFDRDRWETDGKALLNLSPTEAIRFYENDLEVIERELARRP